MQSMNAKNPLRRQMAEAYDETNVFGRIVVSALLVLALAALFIFRAATSDPLWESEAAQAAQKKASN